MMIDSGIIILFIGLFAGLVGFIGQSMINRLESIDHDLKELLIDHGQRITTLEAGAFKERRKEPRQKVAQG